MVSSRVHPFRLLSLIGICSLLLVAAMIALALQERVIDVRWVVSGDSVIATAEDGLPRVVTGISNSAGQITVLDADYLIRDPDALPTYADMNRFMAYQSELSELLQGPSAILVSRDFPDQTFSTRKRTLDELPFSLYFQLTCGVLAILITGGIWGYRPYLPSAQVFMLCGIGFMLVCFTMGVYSSRALALPEVIISNLVIINRFGVNLLTYGGAILLWLYPKHYSQFPFVSLTATFGFLVWVNETFQWFEWPLHAYFAHFFVISTLAIFAGALQWRNSRNQPLERAALRWLALSFLVCFTGIWLLFVLPIIFYTDLTLNLEVASLLVLCVFIGVALGISRYRLFDLDRWWLEAWVWFLSGLAVIVVDVLLIMLLNIGFLSSLALTVLVVGWLYFPLRQWLLSRLLVRKALPMQDLLPDIMTFMLKPHRIEEPDQFWLKLLNRSFSPIQVTRESDIRNAISIEDDGMVLSVPRVHLPGHYEVVGCQKGQRLFNSDDARQLDQLYQLLVFGEEQYRLRENSTERERNRIMRDLHDDVGAKLLTLIHRTPPEQAELARSALSTLRDTIYSLRPETQIPLQEFFEGQREEVVHRCESFGVELHWRFDEDKAYFIPAHLQINLSRILRELLTNALKHGSPTRISIHISCLQHRLSIEQEHDGIVSPVESWTDNNGMLNLKRRTSEINGYIEFRNIDSGLHVELALTLDDHG